jgi:hypothetical protein
MAAGRAASVVAAAPVGITAYDADGDCRRRRCPRGAAMVDVMMTMAGERWGEVTVRQRRGDVEATARRRQVTARRRRGDGEATARRRRGDGDYKATTRQQGCEGNRLWHRRWQGQRCNRQEHNK